ncbi:MAG: hypothetical protein ACE5JM_14615, partial [Armatimonadota bacterium]
MLAAASKRALGAIAQDLRAFGRQMRAVFGAGRTQPGMYAHSVGDESGRRRLHLRVHEDGSGVLFVNVSHVIHLTPVATEIVRMLLDGVSAGQILRLLHAWYPGAPAEDVRSNVRTLEKIVTTLAEPQDGCPTCLPELARAPLFALRPHAPYKADIALTYACNDHCAHCYNEPGRRDIPPLDLRGWRHVLRRRARIGGPPLIFTGGEPPRCGDGPA